MATASLIHLDTEGLAPALPKGEAERVATQLGESSGTQVYPGSIAASRRSLFFLGRRGDKKLLGVVSADSAGPGGLEGLWGKFAGETARLPEAGAQLTLTLGDTTAANAAALREALPFLVPQPLGLRKSVGCGDRLGLATPGHVRAVRRSAMAPILAQQSMRENARTGRTPQEVMDDAMWGVFQEGWREGFGADADHLKTPADIDLCAAAGYTFYTVDPGEYVDNGATTDSPEVLRQKVSDLPWPVLGSDPADLERRLADVPIDLGSFRITIGREELLRAAAKYGRAVAHTVSMYRHLLRVMGERPCELEMSVDETETITTLAEHVYIVHELKRLGVKWVSLAPRYVGTFEKGVDYIGDLRAFEESFARHLAVAQTFGPYKLSLHSGSDKFSIYPIAARLAGDLVHLKTAGTSYLEALRAIAKLNPALFREIVALAIDRYPVDRASYHVSASLARMPDVTAWPDDRLAALLEDFDGREVLHVTFGSVLNHEAFREPFFSTLRSHEETYYQILEDHFSRHLAPFGAG
ncbi:MAG TPA: tagaturonate epimerase family protein [Terriglobia bacterium]|nr:tagaturonate epimerase family protein [Terriglobia bacterium]